MEEVEEEVEDKTFFEKEVMTIYCEGFESKETPLEGKKMDPGSKVAPGTNS